MNDMGYLDHIHACNRHDPLAFVPFFAGGAAVGRVHRRALRVLRGLGRDFTVSDQAVRLTPDPDDFEGRSAAMARALPILAEQGWIRKLRREAYPVLPRWGAAPLMRIDRGGVVLFGIGAYGLHVNGYVRKPDGSLELWIGRRSADRGIAPGKLDNLVGGGQPIGLTLTENLVKEAEEEAGIPAALALSAKSAGVLTYVMETEEGLKPDTLFIYDLDLPEDFVPVNRDGEVERFERLPIDQVAAIVRDTDRFKFNCNLVIIDFLIRHGFINPDNEPDYVEIVRGMHR